MTKRSIIHMVCTTWQEEGVVIPECLRKFFPPGYPTTIPYVNKPLIDETAKPAKGKKGGKTAAK